MKICLLHEPHSGYHQLIYLLCDVINETKTLGSTLDVDKINYNLDLIGGDFKKEFKIKLGFQKWGVLETLDLGRYIAIIYINKQLNSGYMYFIDTNSELSRFEILNHIKEMFGNNCNITKRFMAIYDLLKSNPEQVQDNVEIIVQDDRGT